MNDAIQMLMQMRNNPGAIDQSQVTPPQPSMQYGDINFGQMRTPVDQYGDLFVGPGVGSGASVGLKALMQRLTNPNAIAKAPAVSAVQKAIDEWYKKKGMKPQTDFDWSKIGEMAKDSLSKASEETLKRARQIKEMTNINTQLANFLGGRVSGGIQTDALKRADEQNNYLGSAQDYIRSLLPQQVQGPQFQGGSPTQAVMATAQQMGGQQMPSPQNFQDPMAKLNQLARMLEAQQQLQL